MDTINLQVIRDSFGRVVYSHKTHEKESECYAKKIYFIKCINVILTTSTSGTLLTYLIIDQNSFLITSAILSTLVLMFTIFQLSFKPEEKAQQHKYTANLLWSIRERYINLIADIINEAVDNQKLIDQRDSLLRELDLIYKSAPTTGNKSYKAARKALKIDDEMTFTNKEINQFLPKSLWIE